MKGFESESQDFELDCGQNWYPVNLGKDKGDLVVEIKAIFRDNLVNGQDVYK